jgi:hypothetical protein
MGFVGSGKGLGDDDSVGEWHAHARAKVCQYPTTTGIHPLPVVAHSRMQLT